MRGKNILITGAAGFIGSNLVESLIEENRIVAVDNLSNGSEENIREFYSHENFTFHKIDVKDKVKLKKVLDGIDIIFHLSANADVRRGYGDTKVDMEENMIATYSVLESMRENDVNELIFSSTSTVYGNVTVIPTPENYGPLIPISHYGASKLAAEAFIFSFSNNYGFRSSIFRFANIVGKKSSHGVIFDFKRKLKKNREVLEVLGDGTQSKSYLHVDDCIEGILKLHGKSDGLFNLGTKQRTSVTEIANMMIEKYAPNARIEFTGGPGGAGWTGDVKTMQLDISKAERNGWKYKYESKEAVRKAIEEAGE
jgi:UDP-glucose 4-epimerase